MRIKPMVAPLLLGVMTLGIGTATAADTWAVATPAKLDLRLHRQLEEVAARHQAEVRTVHSFGEASRLQAKLLIELREEKNLDSFLATLKREGANFAAEPTAELAREGYVLESFYPNSSIPNRIRITAATPAGAHHALLRVPELLRNWPSNLSVGLAPAAKSVRVERGEDMVVLADFPSFPERGIVEGFYGTPWSHQDRLGILRFAGQHSMNVYYYAPKDDPYHRRLWRVAYPPAQMKRLRDLVDTARENFVDFCFAISPGLSMVYSSDEDFSQLTGKLSSVAKLGVSCFALFLDDVPPDLESPRDQARFKTLAQAHVDLINKLDRHLKSLSKQNRLIVTPTTYTNEWGSRDYVRELGAGASPDVAIVWTGPEVVSPAITVAQAREWGELLKRKPLLWDNFPVNDGIPWRVNLGPLRGRDANLPVAVRGLFSNPMNQARASLLPLETIAEYLWNSLAYDPERAQRRAVINQYSRDALELLAPFLEIYGDYWWQDNIFQSLFVETRKAIDIPRIEREIARLEAALEPLRNQERFQRIFSELSPLLPRTRERLAQLIVHPAFRRLPDQRLLWRDDYDTLYAPRLSDPPKLDGDFEKWQSGPLYFLGRASQIFSDPKLWKGPEHFSAHVALGWNEDYLYVGVDVTDPGLYQPFTGRRLARGDHVVLTLETAFRKNFENTRAATDEYRLLFSPGNFVGVPPSSFCDEDFRPPRPEPRDYEKEIKTAWKKTPEGFSGDIAIPVSYFDGRKFFAGYEIGLSFDARKVIPPPPGKPADEENLQRIIFRSKTDRLFPINSGNPSTYQRLVLIDLEKP